MSDQVATLIRTLLKFAGGFLVAKGTISDGALVASVGAVSTLVGVIWSAVTHTAYNPPSA